MRAQFSILSLVATLISSTLLAQNASHVNNEVNFLEENAMESYKLVKNPAIQVIGIACRTSNAPEEGPQDIPQLWGRFYSEDIISRIPNKVSHEVIALYCDYEGVA